MNEKDLLKKLDSLKSLKPDSTWKDANRELLLSQVSASGADYRPGFLILVRNFFAAAPQPALIGLGVFVLLFGAVIWGGKEYGQPDNSLYIARTLDEKVQVSTTFDTATKKKVEAEIAVNRAQDIVTAMAKQVDQPTEASADNNKLNESFKNEIQKVKDQLIVVAGDGKVEQGIEVNEERATNTPYTIIDEAQKLVDEKNYGEALNKIQEASALIK